MKDKPSKFAGLLRSRQDSEEIPATAKRGRPGGKGKPRPSPWMSAGRRWPVLPRCISAKFGKPTNRLEPLP